MTVNVLGRALSAERQKLRRSPVWLAFLIIPAIPAVMGTANYLGNVEILRSAWYSLWTQHSLFTCYFFLPSLIAVYCAYLCRLEHQCGNWNTVLSAPVPFAAVYSAKLILAGAMVALTQLWTGVLFTLCGKLAGLGGMPPAELVSWLICGLAGGIVICSVQLFLSLVIPSFAVPVGVALLGGIGGMLALTKGFGLFFPYALISIGMRANNPGGAMAAGAAPFAASCVLFVAIFAALSLMYVQRRDL